MQPALRVGMRSTSHTGWSARLLLLFLRSGHNRRRHLPPILLSAPFSSSFSFVLNVHLAKCWRRVSAQREHRNRRTKHECSCPLMSFCSWYMLLFASIQRVFGRSVRWTYPSPGQSTLEGWPMRHECLLVKFFHFQAFISLFRCSHLMRIENHNGDVFHNL